MLNLGVIGFGCMKASFSASEQNRQSTIEALHTALDLGVRLFDTADIYAPTWDAFGHNELLVAEAMRTHPLGSQAIIATKGGITRKPGEVWGRNASLDYLLRAAEASAGRLGVSKISIWQHHRLDPNMPFEQQIENLAGLRQRGIIEHIGVSNYSAKQLRRALEVVGPIVSVQNQFSPVYRNEADVFEVCEAHGIAYLPWSPSKGLHAGDARNVIHDVADELGLSPYAVGVAWLRNQSSSVIPIPGVTRTDSVVDSIAGSKLELEAGYLERINRGLPATLPMDSELLSDQPKN
jgi:aryl-alcohol dehydrogenase-like predicted oxidoreductase